MDKYIDRLKSILNEYDNNPRSAIVKLLMFKIEVSWNNLVHINLYTNCSQDEFYKIVAKDVNLNFKNFSEHIKKSQNDLVELDKYFNEMLKPILCNLHKIIKEIIEDLCEDNNLDKSNFREGIDLSEVNIKL